MLIGLNPVPPQVFPVNCQTCHGFPHAGSDVVLPPQRDLGVGGQATAASFNGPLAVQNVGFGPAPANDLPKFKFTCINGATHPFYGTQIITNDPGKGLITGKCADLGQQTVPQLRGLAARAPYFHDGSASDSRRRGGLLQPALRDEPDGPGKDRSGQFLVRTLVDDRR